LFQTDSDAGYVGPFEQGFPFGVINRFIRSISSEGAFDAERFFLEAGLGTDIFFAMLFSSFARSSHFASVHDGALS
jgi:hypothetical protein